METGKLPGREKKEIGLWAARAALGAALLLLLFLNLFYLENWLDSDMAAEMIFSRLLAEEGGFLATDRWYYSTEFRVLYTQLFMEPLFVVCRNWHVVRLLTNLLTYAFLLGSYFYMTAPLKLRKSIQTWSALLLLLPLSETFVLHVQIGNTYMMHMILIQFVFGMFLRLSSEEERQKPGWHKSLLWAGYLLLSLVCGLSGVRYLLALQGPLMLTCAVVFLRSDAFAALRKELSVEKLRELFGAQRLRYLSVALAGTVCSLAGYLLNATVVASVFDFQTYEATNFISVYQGVFLERLQDTFGSLLMLFGYIPDKGVLSLRGAVTFACFLLLAGILFLTCRTGRLLEKEPGEVREAGPGRTHEPEPMRVSDETPVRQHRRFLRWFFIVTFFLNTFVFVFSTSTIVPRYYLTVFLFAVPLAAVYFEEERLPLDRLLVALVLGGCLALAAGKTVFSFMTTDKNADKREVCAFLEKEGYDFGYATYWNANIVTELTGGQVEVANIGWLDRLDYFYWSSPKKYYEEEHPGKVFLLVTAEQKKEYENEPVIREGKIVYQDDYYVVYHFDSGADWEAYREEKLQ